MKTRFLVCLLFFSIAASAQSVAINHSGAAPDSSAILDINANNKGVLLPRVYLMGTSDTVTIPKPQVSLLVYNTNPYLYGGKGYYAWNGSSWDLMLSNGNAFVKGRNRFTTVVDSAERVYWVHVPPSYDSAIATPVVFMLHGTGGNGEKFYNYSGWKELGEAEGFISVFPSSMLYWIIHPQDGLKRITKWNTIPDTDFTLAPGETGKDDIKFLRKIVVELKQKFNVDTTRIYMNGFSNGGQMASKCAAEMSDVFAAVVSNAGTFLLRDTTYTPVRKLPIMFQVGNVDYGPGNTGPVIPLMYFDSLLRSPNELNGRFYYYAHNNIRHFGLDSNYTLVGDTGAAMVAAYHSLTPGDTLNIFRYVFVNGLAHSYPNGENHWFDAPTTHWAWLRQYRKP